MPQKLRVSGPFEAKPDWVEKELQAMHERVNLHRARLGKDDLPLEEVERVEITARGHSDYSTKFALYCTELVQDTL